MCACLLAMRVSVSLYRLMLPCRDQGIPDASQREECGYDSKRGINIRSRIDVLLSRKSLVVGGWGMKE